MEYIDRIKKIKNQKKITNDKLSEMTGIPLGTLSKIMAEISDSPKFSNILSICDALGCSVNYIVTGEPDNDNNFKLEAGEIKLVENYRKLDTHGREIVSLVLNKESERITAESYGVTYSESQEKKTRVLNPLKKETSFVASGGVYSSYGRRTISLYNMPVSAGKGLYLDRDDAEDITIPDTVKTQQADYALRIRGNSMEPRYHDGDILLIQNCDSVEIGELGIFVLDGEGYFKCYGGDRLVSLNQDYGDILLKDFESAECCGKVVGKLKRK